MLRLCLPTLALGLSSGLLGVVPTLALAQTTPIVEQQNLIRQMRATSVRLLTDHASGSGVIVRRQGSRYTVLTSWHVLAFSPRATLLTPDGQRHRILRIQQLGNADIAQLEFSSDRPYRVAPISQAPVQVNTRTYALGFPMYQSGTLQTTFDQGVRAFRLTQGRVTLVLPKALTNGYRLGYSNAIAVGMSGGPIFNDRGEVIGINGRLSNRDPDFGVYAFEDGTAPSPELLEQIIQASWGIPVARYFR
jgi:S1-C subfamily serine protease